MSLIKTHHLQMNGLKINESELSYASIKIIVDYIVNNHSALIVDIESGLAQRSLLITEIISYMDSIHQYFVKRDELIDKVMNYMFGYGVLQSFIDDEDITDIDICRFDFILIKKFGKKTIVPTTFDDEETFTNYCKLIIIRNGGIINENDCHARVSDEQKKLRINVSIGPRNTSGTSMTIRKHRHIGYSLEDLIQLNMMSKQIRDVLKMIMRNSSRVLIIGKGAAGKTTLLRSMLKEIPLTERFLICESESELYPENANFIVQKVQTQKKNMSLSQLVKDGLTMSLDGYCVGELIGAEVYDFIKAGYTDHRILGTLHAHSPQDTITRILSMIGNHQIDEGFISGAIDYIIYVKKFKVMSITHVKKNEGKAIFNSLVTFDLKKETPHNLIGEYRYHIEK